jgi:hypothetical protein
MRAALRRPPYPYEDTRTWDALRSALAELERAGALHLVEGERPVLAVLCRALDRAGVFSPGGAAPEYWPAVGMGRSRSPRSTASLDRPPSLR